MNKKILVAIDGSTYSTNTLHYLATLFADCDDLSLDLISIIVQTSTGSLEEAMGGTTPTAASLSPKGIKTHRAAAKYLDTATHALLRAGFTQKRLAQEIKIIPGNIARHILQWARQGNYDALVIGRRGVGKLEEMVMGSVSASILQKCHDIPIWIVDGRVDATTFLVPVDMAPHTMAAIDHLGFMLSGNDHGEITLFHSNALFQARSGPHPPQAFHAHLGQEWCELNLGKEDSHFSGAEKILMSHGINPQKIHRLHTERGIHPSRQIIRQALKDDFGTIVMGRRKQQDDRGLLGGISDRVIHMAEHVALWIVG